MTGAVVFAQEPAQADTTLLEAPKSANADKSANSDEPANSSAGLATAHPKPAKRLNARERQMAKKSGGYNDRNTTEDGTTPMTATAKSKVAEASNDKAEEKASAKAAMAKEKATVKAAQKAQKADTKARKISAAKAAKAARG